MLRDVGEIVYLFLYQRLDQGFTAQELNAQIPELQGFNSSRFRTIMRHSRTFAESNGHFIPMAVQEDDGDNPGYMTPPKYRVTNQAVHAFKPSLKLTRQAHGVKRTQQRHDNFIKAHDFSGMSPSQRKVIEARAKADEATRQFQEAADEMAEAYIDQDAEHRKQLRRMADGKE